MNEQCDGGGNRYSSQVYLTAVHPLSVVFQGMNDVPSGVCSIQTKAGETPWIVCPRRLLALGRENSGPRRWQAYAERKTLSYLKYDSGIRLGIWPEVKLKYKDNNRSFDYTFDYLVAPIGPVALAILSETLRIREVTLRNNLQNAGYSFAQRGIETFVEDFPHGAPSLIEIMTSSTSGGNKKERTTIAMAFEDAILLKEHFAPGINYRQVWARMVSQLIVKSEVALAWGGKTIWVVQDRLVEYICKSTALDIKSFLSEHPHEVNMLSFSYGDINQTKSGVIDLAESTLYAGPISANGRGQTPSFQDMIRTPLRPSRERLFSLLTKQTPKNIIIAP
jgi:hypothetical protein